MAIKVLIVDPDISFVLPVKRALEQFGEFSANVFTTARAATEAIQREPQDVAVLDFNVEDMDLPTLISTIRRIQPGLYILVSPRNAGEMAQVASIDAQGSISKPYLARQIAPIIREALSARARQIKADSERRADLDKLVLKPEPAPQPDDTFYRVLAAMYSGKSGKLSTSEQKAVDAALASGQLPAIPSADTPAEQPPDDLPEQQVSAAPVIAEPEIPHDATIRDLVSGQPSQPAEPAVQVEQPEQSEQSDDAQPATVPELTVHPEPDLDQTPLVASLALSTAEDETIPLESLTPPAFIARVEQELGIAWVAQTPANADLPTLVGPTIPVDEESVGDIHSDTQPIGGLVQEHLERIRPADPVITPSVHPPSQPEPEPPAIKPEPPPTAEPAAGISTEPSTESSDELSMPAAQEPPITAEPVASDSVEPVQTVASLAAQLTQLTVTLASQATLITRGHELIASAGRLETRAMAGVAETILTAWRDQSEQTGSLVRFINVPGVGDYLLYSTATTGNMVLSMLFPADTPLRDIRRQARALVAALDNVPKPPTSAADSEADITLLSRPTDPRPPDGLHNATAQPVEAEPPAVVENNTPPQVEGPYIGYSFVWLPRVNALSTDMAGVLLDWINAIAAGHSWQIQGVEAQPSYVTVQISLPASDTPTSAVETLMQETAARADDTSLWADAYYIVTPSRAVTQQEIANFMEYRRSAQDAA